MGAILLNREWNTSEYKDLRQSWYTSREILKSYKSVILSDFYNTSSSAGDWEGYFLQKLNNRYKLILFSQSNNWPHSGYTIFSDKTVVCDFDYLPEESEILQVIADYNNF